jgi:RecA-family ATPase
MPGVMRAGQKQFLIDTNIGKSSWNEWEEWIEGINDDLPEPESMASVWDNLPDLAPPLIDGILRQGHKMLLAGPSKAGKSYALIELCCAIAEGKNWFGWPCAQGKIMYVNLELDRASCLHRFKDVYQSLRWAPRNVGNIDIWNLRGKSVPMDKLAPKLIRRAQKKNYIAVIIDPIYKVITGDENSADQMAHFCNQFDKVCTELGCAVIYCHHHSKGGQGGKKSMDRASGSGVFARDPDALLDLIELDLTEAMKTQRENNVICDICKKWLTKYGYIEKISQDNLCVSKHLQNDCVGYLTNVQNREMQNEIAEFRKSFENITAWRIEGTLREFPKFKPVNLWFDYPIHQIDGAYLQDAEPEGNQPPWQKATATRKHNAKSKKDNKKIKFENAVNNCNFGEPPTVKMLSESLDIKERTVRDWIKEYDYQIDKNLGTVTKKENEN